MIINVKQNGTFGNAMCAVDNAESLAAKMGAVNTDEAYLYTADLSELTAEDIAELLKLAKSRQLEAYKNDRDIQINIGIQRIALEFSEAQEAWYSANDGGNTNPMTALATKNTEVLEELADVANELATEKLKTQYIVSQVFETLGDPCKETYETEAEAEVAADVTRAALAKMVAGWETPFNRESNRTGYSNEIQAWKEAEEIAKLKYDDDGNRTRSSRKTWGRKVGKFIADNAVEIEEVCE